VAAAKILDRKMLEQFELVAKLNPQYKDAIKAILYQADKNADEPSTFQALEKAGRYNLWVAKCGHLY
jgi:hypothetical protein